jgi:hypothetical protein
MKTQIFLDHFRKDLSEIRLSQFKERIIVTLPFTDYCGDYISAGIRIIGDKIVFDDLGRVAGLLFSLGQHTSRTAAFNLVKNLSEAYEIEMDYDEGLLKQSLSSDEIERMIDFCKVISTMQVSIPELRMKKTRPVKSNLVTKLNRDIRHLKLPIKPERQINVQGEKEIWPVSFKYQRQDRNKTEVLILTADLTVVEPRTRAASVITSTIDLNKIENRDIRVVYEVDGIGKLPEVQRAKSLIDQYQYDFKYRTFNYAEKSQKEELLTLTRQDATPLV